MKKRFIHPESLHNFPSVFTQVVVIKQKKVRTIHVSGQTSANVDGQVVGKDDLAAQVEQALSNMAAALAAAHAKMDDVIKTNVYIVDMNPEKVGVVAKAIGKHFTGEFKPASTWIGVQSLVNPDYLIEIEAVAIARKH